MRSCVIAIDGPSGSGKSSAAKGVARQLGLAYLDTGAMYRALCVAYRDAGLTPTDAQATVQLATELEMEISLDPDTAFVAIDGRDVTDEIRTPELSALVSQVATMVPVREVLVENQQAIIEHTRRQIVVEGRDITTVVAPDADVRVLLTADPAARVARRAAELGGKASQAEVTDQVIRRDRDDSTVSEFMTPAEGVHIIDSTDLTLEQVVDAICALVPTDCDPTR